ncbi:MAG: PAS domain-containing protein [Actinobacteria bacterium]|nr:MAG: PAS domain-containing protein [Actinomycetota bacterium]
MALGGPFHERGVNGRTTKLETLVHSRQMADALLVAGVAAGAAAVGAVAVAATSRGRLARTRGQALAARTSLEAIERTSTEERRIRDTILSSMREGVLLVDRDGRCVFANDALVRHLGGSPASLDELFPTEIRRAARRAGYTGAANAVEVETGVPSRWLRANSQPIDGGGSVLVVVRDVTEARRLDAVRRDFVANASHELKTPAASIRAAAETLRNGALEDPPAALRFTEQLQRDAMRLSRIVSDLLDLSRLEGGSDRAEHVRLDVIAADEVERLGDSAEEAGVGIELHADGVPSVPGSARDLALLVRNLIDNAVRYTPRGGRVDVSVSAEDGKVILEVIDTGMGIPQRDLPRVFERFYRVDRARSRETGGTGLGLAIVRHVAENHGGEVTVQSELSAGSTFVVRLPVADPARDDASVG